MGHFEAVCAICVHNGPWGHGFVFLHDKSMSSWARPVHKGHQVAGYLVTSAPMRTKSLDFDDALLLHLSPFLHVKNLQPRWFITLLLFQFALFTRCLSLNELWVLTCCLYVWISYPSNVWRWRHWSLLVPRIHAFLALQLVCKLPKIPARFYCIEAKMRDNALVLIPPEIKY